MTHMYILILDYFHKSIYYVNHDIESVSHVVHNYQGNEIKKYNTTIKYNTHTLHNVFIDKLWQIFVVSCNSFNRIPIFMAIIWSWLIYLINKLKMFNIKLKLRYFLSNI